MQAQTPQFGGREGDGIPFEDDGGLSRISAAEGGWRGGLGTEGFEDLRLDLVKGGIGFYFGGEVARDVDVHDTAGGYVWG